MRTIILAPLAALVMVPGIAMADEPPEQAQTEERAMIPFADTVGIWDWRAEGNRTIYIEDNHRRWYKAVLFSPALDLPFVNFIGIDAGPTGTLDKFGAVYIHGQRYPFASFERVDGPPKKGK